MKTDPFMHARSLAPSKRDERYGLCGATIERGEASCWWTELGRFTTPPKPPCPDCLDVIAQSGWRS